MAVVLARKTPQQFNKPTAWRPGMPKVEPRSNTDPAPEKEVPAQQPAAPPAQPSQPALPPPPDVRDNPFVNGTAGGGVPTTSTATPGSVPTTQPTINPVPPVAPILPPQVDPVPPQIEKMPPPPPTMDPRVPPPQAQPKQPAPYKPSSQAPTVTNVSQTRGRADELYRYGQQAMANPSRYDAELMQANAKVIEDAINRMRQTGMRNLGEHYASRGLTGSSLEGFGVSDLEGELGRYANERATGLMTDAAQTFANDRNQAFGMGMGAAGLGFQGEGRESDDAYRNWMGEQNVYNTGRTQDQNELSLLASLADRFGPEVLRELGYDV